MMNLVEKVRSDVMVVSEANLEKDNKTQDIDYRKYLVESNFLGNS